MVLEVVLRTAQGLECFVKTKMINQIWQLLEKVRDSVCATAVQICLSDSRGYAVKRLLLVAELRSYELRIPQ